MNRQDEINLALAHNNTMGKRLGTIADTAIWSQKQSRLLYMVARDARFNFATDHDLDRYLNFANRAAIESAFARNMADIAIGNWYDNDEKNNNWESQS